MVPELLNCTTVFPGAAGGLLVLMLPVRAMLGYAAFGIAKQTVPEPPAPP